MNKMRMALTRENSFKRILKIRKDPDPNNFKTIPRNKLKTGGWV
jgi:hypothetical protein